MSLTIRDAGISDLDQMAALLVEDGARRAASDPVLWRMEAEATAKVTSALRAAMETAQPPFRQKWLLAEAGGRVIGLTHTILLPVPPIYAGVFGPPGLIMEDCCVAEDAPAGAVQTLLEAAEADLIAAGARIVLGSSVPGGTWEAAYLSNDYAPLTLYLARVGLRAPPMRNGIRSATDGDVPDIVSRSAEHRTILFDLNDFWQPHAEADHRFGAWMHKSLTLPDRDMFVSEQAGAVTGYAISHPATPLHFPTPHDIGAVGVIDDFYHRDFADPAVLAEEGVGAASVLHAAEAALQARGNAAALVVCPAAWASKIAVLDAAGYRNAITWFRKGAR